MRLRACYPVPFIGSFCAVTQLGHQAANCTNGTINWKQIYGEEAFRLKAPLYESDFERLRKVKQVDGDDLAKRAKEYAKVGASWLVTHLGHSQTGCNCT